jgi:hypothetical protein
LSIHVPFSSCTTAIGKNISSPQPEQEMEDDTNLDQEKDKEDLESNQNECELSTPGLSLLERSLNDVDEEEDETINFSSQDDSQTVVLNDSKNRKKARNFDKAGESLSVLGKKGTKRDTLENIWLQRGEHEKMRLQLQQEQLNLHRDQLEIDRERMRAAAELEQQKFKYMMDKDKQELEREKLLTERKAMEIEELKLKLALANATTNNH